MALVEARLVVLLEIDHHGAADGDEIGQPEQLALVGPGLADVRIHPGHDLVIGRQLVGRHDPAAFQEADRLRRVGVEEIELGLGDQVLLHQRRIVAGHRLIVDLAVHLLVVPVDVVLDDVGPVLPAAEIDGLAARGLERVVGGARRPRQQGGRGGTQAQADRTLQNVPPRQSIMAHRHRFLPAIGCLVFRGRGASHTQRGRGASARPCAIASR